jgi:UDP-GlcNAc:undecaprenyl-phosphate GlcNAc-1-phosphate transferase
LASQTKLALTLVVAAGLLHVMGLMDDKHHLGPKLKLVLQFTAAILLAGVGGVRFDFFIPNVWLTTILSVLWIVVIINAFNFLDNMDGLSAGVAVICAAMTLGAAWNSGQVFVSSLLIILIGALCGFLVFNFAPAKIFMGDAGSLLVGLLLATATIRTTYYQQNSSEAAWYNTLMPLIVLAVPLYDFLSVTILRLLQGKSPFIGDKQHFSHRLVSRGMTRRQAVLTIYLATACTGLGATVLHQLSSTGVILVFVQTLLILLIIAILEHPGKV